MIIPIRCMNCGFMLADKWRTYQDLVKKLRIERKLGDEPIYIDGNTIPNTPEREACDKVGVVRYCCRKTLLTHRDLIEKI